MVLACHIWPLASPSRSNEIKWDQTFIKCLIFKTIFKSLHPNITWDLTSDLTFTFHICLSVKYCSIIFYCTANFLKTKENTVNIQKIQLKVNTAQGELAWWRFVLSECLYMCSPVPLILAVQSRWFSSSCCSGLSAWCECWGNLVGRWVVACG